MKKHENKIYSSYTISIIVYYWSMICFLPILMVFSYMLDLQEIWDPRNIILVSLAINGFMLIFVTLLLMYRKNKLKRKIKTHYRSEFIYMMFISAFAILGFVVVFDYLGGNRDYIANLLVLISAIVFVMLVYLGRKYFKLEYITRK